MDVVIGDEHPGITYIGPFRHLVVFLLHTSFQMLMHLNYHALYRNVLRMKSF
jgi:hypothetical protein